ncbi:distal membrane-arm assembly complex protein 2 [Rissa tridactyla]|uniref:distal membrane-arm assembly complex protein 2 n=1 Tax=Rissa tridactyla TaxID=75485 RepID=UPI0023BAAFAD|nr:distal membrane-arm assembly complex protein 2 [Rissa tridactyla]
MAALRAVLVAPPTPCPPQVGQRRGAAGGGLLRYLGRWFYEAEAAEAWAERLRRRRLRSRNAYCGFLRDRYGDDVAAAIFTLSCGGGVRFEGQDGWLRPEGQWRPEVLRHLHVPVVALDLSGSPLTYHGLDNLVGLRRLRQLDLSECPHLDDWALGRLHVFGASLRELSVARCPLVTERGLATLHHLRELRLLDVSGLRVPSPGLVRILLEETLPRCRLRGMDHAGGGHDTPTTPPAPPLKPVRGGGGGLVFGLVFFFF